MPLFVGLPGIRPTARIQTTSLVGLIEAVLYRDKPSP